MKRCTVILVALALYIVAVSPSSLQAASVIPLDLRQCVQLSGLAFAGTVSSMRSEYTPSHQTIVTRVTFSAIVVAKGRAGGAPLVLTLAGGRVGPEEILVPGQPQFEVGRRYIVLTDSDLGSVDNSYVPIIGMYQCYFTVGQGPPGSDDIVGDWAGRPVTEIRDGHVVVLDSRPEAPPNYRVPKQTSEVRDLYRPGRKSSLRPDSLEGSAPRPAHIPAQVDGRGPIIGTSQGRPSKRYPVPEASSMPHEIVSSEHDRGTRVREAQFLEVIRTLSAR